MHSSKTGVYPRLFQTVISVVTVILLLCVLVNCSNDQRIKITIWDFPRWEEQNLSKDRFGWMNAEIAKFQALHPEVDFALTPLDWSTGEEKLLFSFRHRNYPDIFPVNIEQYNYIHDLIEMENLTPMMESDRWNLFEPSALKPFQKETQIFALPMYKSGEVIFINQTLAEKYGVQIPEGLHWNFETFADFVRKGTIDLNQDGKIDIHGLGVIINPGKRGIWSFFLYDNPGLADNMDVHSPQFKKNFNALYQLIVNDKVTPIPTLSDNEGSVSTAFLSGKYLCYAGGLWVTNLIKKGQENGTITDRFSIKAFPAPNPEKAFSFFSIAGYSLSKQKDSRKRDLCLQFMKQIYDKGYNYTRYNVLPVTVNGEKSIENDEYLPVANKILSSGKVFFPAPYWKEVDDHLQRTMLEIYLGNTSLEKGFQKAQTDIDALLNRKRSRK